YPNPFSNQVFIEYTNPLSQHYAIRILDAKGVVVFERHKITDTKTIFDRKGLSAGVYFVEVIDEGVLRRKLLVR
ncbi:MAG TPA: T9SS type A sorting domain-containing protein, partial [Flavobacteriales bacterium]|nr:T9SS type A sorting domain-containing protein [Flavobacteriales bacterium]